jgi:hypothetical protein
VLTDAGLDKLRAASGSHVAQVRAFFEQRFSEDELKALAQLLGRLQESVEDVPDCSPS